MNALLLPAALALHMSCSAWADLVLKIAAMSVQERVVQAWYWRHQRPRQYSDYLWAMRYVRSMEIDSREITRPRAVWACEDLTGERERLSDAWDGP